MAAMRAIVTGGAGFIGSHVVDALVARGDEVHALDDLSTGKRENVGAGAVLHEADIRDPDSVFDLVRPQAVFHLAAQASVGVSVERPELDAEINVLGTVHVLEAARRHGAVFNVGTGRGTTVLELVDAMRAATGRAIDPEHAAERLGDLRRSILDPSLAGQELGRRAQTSLE